MLLNLWRGHFVLSAAAHNGRDLTIYGGQDPRDLPAYPVDLAARILLLPRTTLKAWVFGATWYEKQTRRHRRFEPLIEAPDRGDHMLSFVNLVEAHVLKSIRRKHYVQMDKIRAALEHLKESHPETKHPLADVDLLAGGRDMFIQEHGALLHIGSEMGKQIAMEFLILYLNRVERNLMGFAARLFPFVAKPIRVGKKVIEQDSRIIAIDPYVSFGRPIINGTGIPTDAIADRFWGGDSIEDLVKEFDRPQIEIEYALRYENAQIARPN